MGISQFRAKRKPSGGVYKRVRKKRLKELGDLPTLTKIEKKKLREKRMYGGKVKYALLSNEIINVYNQKENKYVKAKMVTVVENPANRHYVRRNFLTKGTIVKTDIGNVKITSRPGQDGVLNGILVEEKAVSKEVK